MGLGIGKYCERCGDQIGYDNMPPLLREEGAEYDLCGTCNRIVEFDKKIKN